MKLRIVLLVMMALFFGIAVWDASRLISYRPSRSVQAQQEWQRKTGSVIPIDDSTVDNDECQIR